MDVLFIWGWVYFIFRGARNILFRGWMYFLLRGEYYILFRGWMYFMDAIMIYANAFPEFLKYLLSLVFSAGPSLG